MRKKFRIDLKEGKGNKDFTRGRVTGIMNCILEDRYTPDGRQIFDYLWYSDKKDTSKQYMICNATDADFEKVKDCLIKARLYPKIIDITELKKN